MVSNLALLLVVFPNDGVSSMAVKMLKLERKACSEKVSVTQTSLQMRGLVMAYDATNQTTASLLNNKDGGPALCFVSLWLADHR